MKIFEALVLCVCVMFFSGCGEKSMDKMSPGEIIELEISSYMSADRETLRKIMYFPPEMSEKDIKRKLSTHVADGNEKMARTLYYEKVEYARFIDDNTAEVGTVILGRWFMFFAKRRPFRQIILKKENSIWKFHYTTDSLSVAMLREILCNTPNESNAYYLLGEHLITRNPKRSLRCYNKYLELNPKGFWAGEYLRMKVAMLEKNDCSNEEDRIHSEWVKFPSLEFRKVYEIAYLARMFWEMGNSEKVEYYLNMGNDIYNRNLKYKEDIVMTVFNEAKTEIENEMKRGASSGADCY